MLIDAAGGFVSSRKRSSSQRGLVVREVRKPDSAVSAPARARPSPKRKRAVHKAHNEHQAYTSRAFYDALPNPFNSG